MNFNFVILIIIFLFTSCGVKSPPAQAPETSIDSYIKSYTENDDSYSKPSTTKAKK